MRPGRPGRPGWPRVWSCSASTRIPPTASRRRWSGGPTARSSRCPRCCTRWPAGSTAPRSGGHRGAGQRRPGPVPDADQVRYLITAKLLPLGVVAAGGVPRALPKANPLFSLRARGTLLPERIVNLVGAFLRPLFQWPVVVAVIVSVAAVDWWLFAVHGLGGGTRRCCATRWTCSSCRPFPGLRPVPRVRARDRLPLRRRAAGRDRRGHLPGLALVLHQRHRLLPAQPGRPAADRPRRPVFQPGLHAGPGRFYTATSSQVLLLVIAVTHLEMLDQLLPFVRFDGYFILSDLIGVPDLFARVVPIVKRALPAGRRDPRVAGLRRGARIVVTGWCCGNPAPAVHHGVPPAVPPRVDRALWRSARLQAHLMLAAVAGHHYAVAAVDAIGAVLVILPGARRSISWPGWRGRSPPSAGAGPPAVPSAASWPPRPAWRSWRRLPPSGLSRPVPWLVARPARYPGLPAQAVISLSEGGSPMSAVPAVTAQDLELEDAELLPARETLSVPR